MKGKVKFVKARKDFEDSKLVADEDEDDDEVPECYKRLRRMVKAEDEKKSKFKAVLDAKMIENLKNLSIKNKIGVNPVQTLKRIRSAAR